MGHGRLSLESNPLLKSRRPWRLPKARKKVKVDKPPSIAEKLWKKLKSLPTYKLAFFKSYWHLISVSIAFTYFFIQGTLNLITTLSLGFVSLVLSDHLLEVMGDYKSSWAEKFKKKEDDSEPDKSQALEDYRKKLDLNTKK